METQETQFTEMACMRYQRTWSGFEAMFRRGGSTTLSAYCASVHVNYNGMKHWVAASGLSVRRLKKSSRMPRVQAEGSAAAGVPEMFVRIMPPTPGMSVPMHGVCINFPDGVSLTLQECTPEGIVTLLDTYARRRSAREAECSR
jgi:hypothetical protein